MWGGPPASYFNLIFDDSQADCCPDWSAGILACMSAKHEQAPAILDGRGFTPLKNAALQARMPALSVRALHSCRQGCLRFTQRFLSVVFLRTTFFGPDNLPFDLALPL